MVQENKEHVEEIRQTLKLINEFKALGNTAFSWANLLFGWLIICREGSLGDEALSVYIETFDPRGSGAGNEEYYDLLDFTLNDVVVCIPVPLVTNEKALYRLMKVAAVIPTTSLKNHNRSLPELDTDDIDREIEVLKKKLLGLKGFIKDLFKQS